MTVVSSPHPTLLAKNASICTGYGCESNEFACAYILFHTTPGRFPTQYPAFIARARILPQMRAVFRTSVMSLRLFPNSTSRYRSARLWLYG